MQSASSSPSYHCPLSESTPFHSCTGKLHMAIPIVLPLHTLWPPDKEINPCLIYFPFATTDLYNWKFQTPSFTKNPQALIVLLNTALVIHQPTWDDYQQFLQIWFATEERNRLWLPCCKLVPGQDGCPTDDEVTINNDFPTSWPKKDGIISSLMVETGWRSFTRFLWMVFHQLLDNPQICLKGVRECRKRIKHGKHLLNVCLKVVVFTLLRL